MLEEVRSSVDALEEVARELDPLPFEAHDAADLLATFVRGERICAAAKSLLARRIEETKVWRESGHRSAAHWIAASTGATVGAAARTLETARVLEQLPDTDAAFRAGRLSEV